MRKIIILTGLAVCIVIWRMGAMRQEQAPEQQDVTVQTSDNKTVIIPGKYVRYFQTITHLLADIPGEGVIRLSKVSSNTLEILLEHLAIIDAIVRTKNPDETEEQAVQRVASAVPASRVSALKEYKDLVQAADFLESKLLLLSYGIEIANILLSDESMRLLQRNKVDHIKMVYDVYDMAPLFADVVNTYIPQIICADVHTISNEGVQTVLRNPANQPYPYTVAAQVSPDGRTIAVCYVYTENDENDPLNVNWKSELNIIDAHTNTVVHAIRDVIVRGLRFSPDGSKIVLLSDNQIRIVDTTTNTITHTVPCESEPLVSAFSPDNKTLALILNLGSIQVVDLATYESFIIMPDQRYTAVTFSPDGRSLAMGDESGKARVIDVGTRQEQLLVTHTGAINDIAFSPDGAILLTASEDKTARAVEVSKGGELYTISHNDTVHAAWFSPDGTRVVTISENGSKTIKIVDGRIGKELHTIVYSEIDIKGYRNNVETFWNGGKKLVTTGFYANTVKIIDVQTMRELYSITRGNRNYGTLDMSFDGKILMASEQDGAIDVVTVTTLTGTTLDQSLLMHLLRWASMQTPKAVITRGDWARKTWDTFDADQKIMLEHEYKPVWEEPGSRHAFKKIVYPDIAGEN